MQAKYDQIKIYTCVYEITKECVKKIRKKKEQTNPPNWVIRDRN